VSNLERKEEYWEEDDRRFISFFVIVWRELDRHELQEDCRGWEISRCLRRSVGTRHDPEHCHSLIFDWLAQSRQIRLQ
jgi:hypothetical protein